MAKFRIGLENAALDVAAETKRQIGKKGRPFVIMIHGPAPMHGQAEFSTLLGRALLEKKLSSNLATAEDHRLTDAERTEDVLLVHHPRGVDDPVRVARAIEAFTSRNDGLKPDLHVFVYNPFHKDPEAVVNRRYFKTVDGLVDYRVENPQGPDKRRRSKPAAREREEDE